MACLRTIALTTLLAAVLCVPTAEAATTLSIAGPPDPVQDKQAAISVRGSTDAGRTMYAYALTGAQACPDTASAASATGTSISSSYGVYVPAGPVSQDLSFTPSAISAYTLCAYLATSSSAAPTATASSQLSVRRGTASVTFEVPADVAEDTQHAISASGTTELGRTFYAYAFAGAKACPSTASAASATGTAIASSYGTYVPAGAWSQAMTYTSATAGQYTLCGYMSRSSSAVPDGAGHTVFTARGPHGTVTLTPPADPVQDQQLGVQASGSTEVGRTFWSFIAGGSQTCPQTASAASAVLTTLGSAYGTYEPAGEFAASGTFTPPASGMHTVCAYLAESPTTTPVATARIEFPVRRPKASISLSAPGALEQNSTGTVAVAGTTEVGRTVWAFAVPGGECPSTASAASAAGQSVSSSYGTYAAAGPFHLSGGLRPASAGAWTLCGYVAKSASAAPDAAAQAALSVTADPNAPQPKVGRADSELDEEVTPTPLLLGPAAATSGAQRRPLFSWTAWPSWLRSDALIISRIRGSEKTEVLRVGATRFDGLDEDEDEDEDGGSGATDDIASFRGDGSTVTVQLKQDLPPGKYGWQVRRELYGPGVYSELRTFTVMGPPLEGRLRVDFSRHQGKRSTRPGWATVGVSTAPYASVRIELRRQGRSSVLGLLADERGDVEQRVTWSCKRPGGVYRVSVTASDQYGASRTKVAKFRPVTRTRCRAMRAAEAAARRARDRRRAAAERAAERREARAQAREEARYKSNCRAIGGTPALVDLDDGWYWICRSPIGGTLPVPR